MFCLSPPLSTLHNVDIPYHTPELWQSAVFFLCVFPNIRRSVSTICVSHDQSYIPRSLAKAHFSTFSISSVAPRHFYRRHIPAKSEWMPLSDRAYTATDASAVKNAREHDAGLVYEVRSIACSWILGEVRNGSFLCCAACTTAAAAAACVAAAGRTSPGVRFHIKECSVGASVALYCRVCSELWSSWVSALVRGVGGCASSSVRLYMPRALCY